MIAVPDDQPATSSPALTNAVDADLAAIADEGVRRRLTTAFDQLRRNAEYGLVFERHRPESVVLYGRPIRDDTYATLRTHPSTHNAFRVLAVDGCSATVQPVDDRFQTTARTKQVPVENLVPMARFGDPIYPGLVPTGEVLRGGGKPFHTVINGENFHALETLLYAYKGQVDAIYIDPPYNSGARDWKYNNDYVDRDDRYRHSLWLSMMEKRLRLAKRLLNRWDSVLIVTIDEKEYLRLGLLLEQVFPGATIQMISNVINRAGSPRTGRFSRVDEYIFYVFFGASRVTPWTSTMLSAQDTYDPDPDDADESAELHVVDEPIEPDDQDGLGETLPPEQAMPTVWFTAVRRGSGASRDESKNLFYPVVVHRSTGAFIRVGDAIPRGVDRDSVLLGLNESAIWPLGKNDSENRWRFKADLMRKYFADGTARLGKRDKKTGLRPITYLQPGTVANIEKGVFIVKGKTAEGSLILGMGGDAAKSVVPRTVWNQTSHFARDHGSHLINTMLGSTRFDFPKSLYAVEDTLRFVIADKPDALVLDFFAGSGTTAHAVMRLNRQDGGRRRSILVTNNEVSADDSARLTAQGLHPGDDEWEKSGVCEYVTKPRVRAAITGLRPDGEPIEWTYRFVDPFPASEGFQENARFFDLAYLDPETVEAKHAFGAIAHLLWLMAGAAGPVITTEPRSGWAMPKGANYGILFRPRGRSAMATALRKRIEAGEALRRLFVIADSEEEFHRSIAEIGVDPRICIRLYRDYLKNFRTNVVDLQEQP